MKRLIFTRILPLTIAGVAAAGFLPELLSPLVGRLPIIFALMCIFAVLAFFIARGISNSIAKPLNDIDLLDLVPFKIWDELHPFSRRIASLIAQRDEQLHKIRQNEAKFENITSQMNEGLILLDEKRRIVSINKSARSHFRVSGEFFNRNLISLTRDQQFLAHAKTAVSGESSEFATTIGARTYQMLFSAAESGAIILILDISEKTAAEQMRREFSANVSHELKTPLTTIVGYAEIIRSNIAKPGDIPIFAQKIMDESNRLLVLINDIILLSKLDERAGSGEKSPCDILSITARVFESLALKAAESDVGLAQSGNCPTVTANPDMLHDMLLNIVDNGIKYNKRGGSVLVELSETDGRARIAVSDTGIGIPKESIARVFERFYTVDKSRSKRTGGTGLGLSIVKHITHHHGGTVELRSKLGEGTTVEITL
ncbi:MAG: ATP-binding protein [Defluviitaleaceae bacterium]|nr:ATP-binding protein [Defluviitaleaceae bacterium]